MAWRAFFAKNIPFVLNSIFSRSTRIDLFTYFSLCCILAVQIEVTERAAMTRALIRIFSSRGLAFIVILGLILFGCQKRSQQKQVEEVTPDGIEKFLRYAMITQSGVYTLVGAKPVTEFSNLTIEPSQERLLKIYERLSQRARDRDSFEEVSYHFKEEYELWVAWSKVKDEYMGENFRFFADPYRKDNVVFANLAAVALVLDQYYEDFRGVYGQDFEPTEMVYSIDSADSEFWKACFSDHYLSGLLYGFGQSNSKLFAWEWEKKKPGKARVGSYNGPIEVNNPDVTQLSPPSFIVYSPLDEKVLFYRNMREKIIELYEGKDFKELTLKLLSDSESALARL